MGKAGVASAEVAEDADGVLVGSDQDWYGGIDETK